MQPICEQPTAENGKANTLPPLRQRRFSLATRVPRVQPRIELAATKVHDLAQKVQDLAQAQLRAHPHLRARGESVQIVCHANRLVLTGTVSSFYLKQLAQESVRHLGSGMTIDNQINVRYS